MSAMIVRFGRRMRPAEFGLKRFVRAVVEHAGEAIGLCLALGLFEEADVAEACADELAEKVR